MNPAVLLQLFHDLEETILARNAEIARLRTQLATATAEVQTLTLLLNPAPPLPPAADTP